VGRGKLRNSIRTPPQSKGETRAALKFKWEAPLTTSVHQFNENRRPDHEFIAGAVKFLVAGNACRLKDRRRTPGFIETIFNDSGMFRWRINDFEDSGKYWDVPFEDVSKFQFEIGSREEPASTVNEFQATIDKFQHPLVVEASINNCEDTNQCLEKESIEIQKWLSSELQIVPESQFDPTAPVHSPEIAAALQRYLDMKGVAEQERLTAETYVLNPSSGEWIKGMQIVLAEMGLKNFSGKAIRTESLFEGLGRKDLRRLYLSSRLSFVRAAFRSLGRREVVLFRGMSAEGPWRGDIEKFFSSWTFSKQVAEAFASFSSDGAVRHSYLVKRTFSVDKLFMTFVETHAMNKSYQEAEATVIHDESDRQLW
jgi:hypothetical protein